MSRLEWMIASRYVKLAKSRKSWLQLFAAPFFFIAGLLRLGVYLIARAYKTGALENMRWVDVQQFMRNAWFPVVIIAWSLLFLLWLARRYTIFTSISTFGLYLGSAALVVVLSIMSGFEQDLKQKILGANAHILVTSPDQPFTDYEHVAERLKQVRGVESVSPYLSNEVMISSQANLAGVILKGIDPATASSVTDLGRNMKEGKLDNLVHPENVKGAELFDDSLRPKSKDKDKDKGADTAPEHKHGGDLLDANRAAAEPGAKGDKPGNPDEQPAAELKPKHRVLPGVLVGRELAKNLRVFLGDEVNVISPMGDIGPTGPMPRSRTFRVVGIFYSGMYEYDTKHVYMSIPAAQKFLGMPDEVTGVEVRITDPDEPQPVVTAIQKALAAPVAGADGAPVANGANQYQVQDWQELNRSLFSALKIEKIVMFIGLCFIILVAGFAIIANGIMLVREKGRHIAMLKSMGATDQSILKTFLYMGAYIGLIGIVAGIVTGIAVCLELRFVGITLDTDVYYIAKLPVQMSVMEIVAVFGAALTIALAATLYPALVAARLRPVDGLRNDQG